MNTNNILYEKDVNNMTNKKIVIDSCEHCPLAKWENDHIVCTHPDLEGIRVTHLPVIDTDCPLEDN